MQFTSTLALLLSVLALASKTRTANAETFRGAQRELSETYVDLGTADNYAILAQTGITTTGTTAITGNIAVSPITTATSMTGFSLVFYYLLEAGYFYHTKYEVAF
jgi:hypothetical protein